MKRMEIKNTPQTELNLDKYIEMRILLNKGSEVLVIAEDEPESVFGKYFDFFNLFMKRGKLILKSSTELKEEDFDKPIYEF